MKRRTIMVTLLIFMFLLLPLLGHGQPVKQTSLPSSLAFGTSSTGSSFYVISVGMAEILHKKTGVNFSVEPVGGADANARALKNKKIDLAIVGAWSVANGFLGIQQFAKEGRIPLRVLLQGQESIRNIVVRNDSGIKTPADLRGKKFIGIRPASSDLELITNALLRIYDIPKSAVKILQAAEVNEVIEALKIGTVDGAIVQGGIGASNLIELFQTTPVSLLSIPDDKLEIILNELGIAFHKVVVPANTYKGQNQDAKFPAFSAIIATMANFPEESAYLFTKILLESPQELTAVHSVGKEWNVKTTLQTPPAPFHPGAIKYFKEKGLWTAALETEQNKLLSRK